MPTDELLISDLAAGREDALGLLYARYAPIVSRMARHEVDPATAEEIVQDVFLAVWRNASSFDPQRGPLRPWLLQIAHYRVANELRRRSRRPRAGADPDGARMANLPDPASDQTEEIWQTHRREILKRSLEQLPPPQRQALGLAYFEDLSHGEIAAVLDLPLGTAKTRVRTGLAALRRKLAPLVAVLAFLAVLTGVGVEVRNRRRALETDEKALTMLTSSDAQALRLTAAPDVRPDTHGVYRFRPGAPTVVMTFSNFTTAPSGRSYQAWALLAGRWTSLGLAHPDAAGRARLIAEGSAFAVRPEALEVTVEPETGSPTPAGPVIIGWTAR